MARNLPLYLGGLILSYDFRSSGMMSPSSRYDFGAGPGSETDNHSLKRRRSDHYLGKSHLRHCLLLLRNNAVYCFLALRNKSWFCRQKPDWTELIRSHIVWTGRRWMSINLRLIWTPLLKDEFKVVKFLVNLIVWIIYFLTQRLWHLCSLVR